MAGVIPTSRGQRVYPVGPFRDWLIAQIEKADDMRGTWAGSTLGPQSRVAAQTRLSPRTIWRIINNEQLLVTEAVVDHALSNEGGTHIAELYGDEYWKRAA